MKDAGEQELRPAGIRAESAIRIAEQVRAACVQAALEAYERASFDGLCDAGALEVVLDAVRSLDLERLVRAERE